MEKFRIVFYQKFGSIWFTNGGRLIITENEFIVKYLFQTVVRFDIDKTIVSRIPANFINVGMRLNDGVKEIDLYFSKKTANRLYNRFNI